VGEDLGTVPEGLREALGEHNILSYRVLLFERDEHSFLPPDRYPRLAIAVAGNHDLPTQRAWWAAGDIDLKESLGLFPTAPDAQRARAERSRDRRDLLEALRRARLVGAGDAPVEELVAAVHAFLARSGAALALAQIDDIVGETTPVNVPATADEHPNWRRRQASTLEELDVDPRLSAVAALFGRRRQGNRR
jgi:4-alpha-glucanotransferase